MTVRILTFCIFTFALANPNDQTQIEKYGEKVKTYRLDVPGKEPITIIETAPVSEEEERNRWEDISINPKKDDIELKNLMTHIIHEVNENPKCYGPSCQDGFNANEGPQKDYDGFELDSDKINEFRDFSKERLQAITALAAKLKKDKFKTDRYSFNSNDQSEEEDNSKVFTSWNRLKVKQHKHPFDDKDGWVTLEPVAWSTSKISKWKPNVKKHKPNHWNEDEDRFPNDDRYDYLGQGSQGSSYGQGMGNGYSNNNNFPQKKPSMSRPGFINNKLHIPADYESEIPSKPSWTKPQQPSYPSASFPTASYPSTWSPDEGRRPYKPNCESQQDSYPGDSDVLYGISDSVVTDQRPSHFPYDYEALHQTSMQRPIRRPTQVVYAGSPDLEGDRSSRPPYGDGQWVLLSTTKGYRNKKRQRSLSPVDDRSDYSTMTSHQAVALTVLPVDKAHTNMTTSHGGLLEVEKSFQTVEESKRDMDKKNDLEASNSYDIPLYTNRVVKRKVVPNTSPDSSTVLAAVGAGMLPATMAMVVPMMLGRRRRRDIRDESIPEDLYLDNIFNRNQ